MKKRNVFWGIFFLLAAIFVIVGKLGYFAEFSFFSLFFTIILIGIFISSLVNLHFWGIFFPAAFLAIIYDKQLGITSLTPWTVLGAALLASIGCSLLFRGSKYKKYKVNKMDKINHMADKGNMSRDHHGCFSNVVNEEDRQTVNYDVNFGSGIKYVHTDDFQQANLSCSFGSMKVYFDNAIIKEPGTRINIDVSFGGLELFIPHDWNLLYSVDCSLSGIEEKNKRTVPGTIDVSLTGDANFSGITIWYI